MNSWGKWGKQWKTFESSVSRASLASSWSRDLNHRKQTVYNTKTFSEPTLTLWKDYIKKIIKFFIKTSLINFGQNANWPVDFLTSTWVFLENWIYTNVNVNTIYNAVQIWPKGFVNFFFFGNSCIFNKYNFFIF